MKNPVAVVGNILFTEDNYAIINSVFTVQYDNGNDYSEDGYDYLILRVYDGVIKCVNSVVEEDLILKLLRHTHLSVDEISELTSLSLDLIHNIDRNR